MKQIIIEHSELIINKLIEKNTINSKSLIDLINALIKDDVIYQDIELLRLSFGGDKFRIINNLFYFEVGNYLIKCDNCQIDTKKLSTKKKLVDNFELLNNQLISELGLNYWVESVPEVKEVKEDKKKKIMKLIQAKQNEITQLINDLNNLIIDDDVKEEVKIIPEKTIVNLKYAGSSKGSKSTKFIKKLSGLNLNKNDSKRFEGEILNEGDNLLEDGDIIISSGWDGSSPRFYKIVEIYQLKNNHLELIDIFELKNDFDKITVKLSELLNDRNSIQCAA